MSCQFDKKYLLQYSDCDMSTSEIKKTKKHIDSCSECRSTLKDIEQTKEIIKLGYQNMPRPNCPDEDAVNRYHSGQMSKDEEQMYEKHFNECIYCQVEQRHFKYKLTDKMKKETSLPLSQEKIAEIKKKVFGEVEKWQPTEEKFKEFVQKSIKNVCCQYVEQKYPMLIEQLNILLNKFYQSAQENPELSGAYASLLDKNELASLLKTGKVTSKKDRHKELPHYAKVACEIVRNVLVESKLPAKQKLSINKHINEFTKWFWQKHIKKWG